MKVIGITGGIASGKSTVSRYLLRAGYPVIDSDQLAREVVAPGTAGYEQVVAVFGHEYVQADGQLNRALLGDRIFIHSSDRQLLEAITHPLIFEAIDQKKKELAQTEDALVFIDMPLLYEVGYEDKLDEVWVVFVDSSTQEERLMRRNHLSKSEARALLATQMPIQDKVQRANAIINNSGGLEETYGQVEKLLRKALS